MAVTELTFLRQFCENDTIRIKKYVDLFLSSIPSTIQKIKDAETSKDWAQIADQAHGLRTKCMLMGMKATQDLSIKVEEDCRRNNLTPQLQQGIATLINHLEQATNELQSI